MCCSWVRIRAVYASHILCASHEPYFVCCMLVRSMWVRICVLLASQYSGVLHVIQYSRVLHVSHYFACKIWVSSCIPSVGYLQKMKLSVVSKHQDRHKYWILNLLVKPVYYWIIHVNRSRQIFYFVFSLRLVIYSNCAQGDGEAHGWRKT